MSPTPHLGRFSPIFPVRDLRAALAHYASLGFETSAYRDGTFYGFADLDGIGLHLSLHDHDHHDHPFTPAGAYLFVQDPDALAAQWNAPGVDGTTTYPALDPPDRGREGTHVDPDGNTIRFGSPVRDA
ncbi:MAG: VOC family protein [Acidimicrobiales bacterium]